MTDPYLDDLEFANKANIEAARKFKAERDALRKGIQDYLDGNYTNPRTYRYTGPRHTCPHGLFYWEACENCIDEHFARLLGETAPHPIEKIEGGEALASTDGVGCNHWPGQKRCGVCGMDTTSPSTDNSGAK